MNEFFTYFLKVNVGLAMFYILYRIAFYRDTFWVGRRVYLMSAIVISALYPLISLSGWLQNSEPIQVFIAEWTPMPVAEFFVFIDNTTEAAAATNPLTWQHVLLLAYIGVCAVFFCRFIGQLFSILRWYRRSRKAVIHNTPVRVVSKDIAPFSFFKTIFVNPQSHSERELKEVLAHESTHVRQWHSVDVLIGEVQRIVCWANPFAWLMRNEIRQNLEFLADNNVVKAGFNAKKYQYHLTELALYSPDIQIANKFKVASLKKRITMMNRRESKKRGLVKYALILPVTLALILWSNAEVVSSSVAAVVENLAVEAPVVEQQQQQAEPIWVVDMEENQRPFFRGGWSNGLYRFFNENLRYPQAALTNNVSGNVSLHFIVEADGSVNNVEIIRGDEVFNAEATRLIRLTRWQPGRQDGRAVRVRHTIGLNFIAENGEGSVIHSPPPPPRTVQQQQTAPPPPPPPPPPPLSGTQEVQQLPTFPGGNEAKRTFLSSHVRYPALAVENNVQGRVVAQFDVQQNGEITNVEIINSVSTQLDNEVRRLINAMPNWTPHTQAGNVRQTLGVVFRLQGEEQATAPIHSEPNDVIVTGFAPQRRETAEVQQLPTFPGGDEAKMRFLSSNVRYPPIAQENGIEGRVVVQFDVQRNGEITDVEAIWMSVHVPAGNRASQNDAAIQRLVNEAIRVINAMPNWTPGETSVRQTQGFVFRLQDEGVTTFTPTESSSNDLIVVGMAAQRRETMATVRMDAVSTEQGSFIGFWVRNANMFDDDNPPPLILLDGVDGVEIDRDAFAAINVDDVQAFQILKNESATAVFGERGRNGVIIVTTIGAEE